MPLYEYKCVQCDDRVEIIQRVSDPPYSRCSKCSGEMKKMFSTPAIQFKGSGFYKNDYASKKESSGGESTSSETKSETKSESKSESKSDSGSGSGTGSGSGSKSTD